MHGCCKRRSAPPLTQQARREGAGGGPKGAGLGCAHQRREDDWLEEGVRPAVPLRKGAVAFLLLLLLIRHLICQRVQRAHHSPLRQQQWARCGQRLCRRSSRRERGSAPWGAGALRACGRRLATQLRGAARRGSTRAVRRPPWLRSQRVQRERLPLLLLKCRAHLVLARQSGGLAALRRLASRLAAHRTAAQDANAAEWCTRRVRCRVRPCRSIATLSGCHLAEARQASRRLLAGCSTVLVLRARVALLLFRWRRCLMALLTQTQPCSSCPRSSRQRGYCGRGSQLGRGLPQGRD